MYYNTTRNSLYKQVIELKMSTHLLDIQEKSAESFDHAVRLLINKAVSLIMMTKVL